MKKNEMLSENEHEERLKDIIEKTPEKHRDWLEKQLVYSNEPTARKRLKEILSENKEFWGLNNKEQQIIVKDIINTRNFYTHFDKNLEKKAKKGVERFVLTELLKWLLLILFLKEIGFTEVKIKSILTRNNTFIYFRNTNLKKYLRKTECVTQ